MREEEDRDPDLPKGDFESEHARRDILANHVVVDGDLVTGQNQNAGPMVAREMMQRLLEREAEAGS